MSDMAGASPIGPPSSSFSIPWGGDGTATIRLESGESLSSKARAIQGALAGATINGISSRFEKTSTGQLDFEVYIDPETGGQCIKLPVEYTIETGDHHTLSVKGFIYTSALYSTDPNELNAALKQAFLAARSFRHADMSAFCDLVGLDRSPKNDRLLNQAATEAIFSVQTVISNEEGSTFTYESTAFTQGGVEAGKLAQTVTDIARKHGTIAPPSTTAGTSTSDAAAGKSLAARIKTSDGRIQDISTEWASAISTIGSTTTTAAAAATAIDRDTTTIIPTDPENLDPHVERTKQEERRLVLETMRGSAVLGDSWAIARRDPTKNQVRAAFKRKFVQHVVGVLTAEGKTPDQIRIIVRRIQNDNFTVHSNRLRLVGRLRAGTTGDRPGAGLNVPDHGDLAERIADSFLAKYEKGVSLIRGGGHEKSSYTAKDARKLNEAARDLNALLRGEHREEDLRVLNLQMINLLRTAFTNPAYEALKEDESLPIIKFLHDVNLAMYMNVHLFQAYVGGPGEEKLGDLLGGEARDEERLGDRIERRRHEAIGEQNLFSGGEASYNFRFWRQAIEAFKSQAVGQVFGAYYDPHSSNAVGALFTEPLEVEQRGESPDFHMGTAYDVRTPSPTVGNKIAPEFRAALQAIQNNRVTLILEKPGYNIGTTGQARPSAWVYTNYQDVTGSGNGEGKRSKVIADLNDEFFVFHCIALSKDSSPYKDGLGEKDPETDSVKSTAEFFLDVRSEIPANTQDFIADLRGSFEQEIHNQREGRYRGTRPPEDAGLYFPESVDQKACFDRVMQQAEVVLDDILLRYADKNGGARPTGKDAWQIKAAVREFVYTGIQQYVQGEVARDLADQGLAVNMITTSACKEDIDRGFGAHIARMFMKNLGDPELIAKVINMAAIMARGRVILDKRVQPIIAVLNWIDPEVSAQALNDITEGVTCQRPVALGVSPDHASDEDDDIDV